MGATAFDFDIDRYVNRFTPRPRLHLLPKPVSWVLGYRAGPGPSQPIGSLLVWFWACIGAFAGLLVVEAVFRTPAISHYGPPVSIASFGAAAILEYHAIDSPFSQPRNAIFGQTFAAIIGVGITKLFHLNSNFENLRWVAGALAAGLSSAFMGLTKTVHPPAGATALLAATNPDITRLGWLLVPLALLGSTLMVAVACVLNNIQRRFPIYWWSPLDLAPPGTDNTKELEGVRSNGNGDIYIVHDKESIMVDDVGIFIPDWLSLGPEERAVLEVLRSRLKHQPKSSSSTSSHKSGVITFTFPAADVTCTKGTVFPFPVGRLPAVEVVLLIRPPPPVALAVASAVRVELTPVDRSTALETAPPPLSTIPSPKTLELGKEVSVTAPRTVVVAPSAVDRSDIVSRDNVLLDAEVEEESAGVMRETQVAGSSPYMIAAREDVRVQGALLT